MAEGRSESTACPNCGSSATATFCADCGERQPSKYDYSLRGLSADVLHELTSLDGRILRSVGALVRWPGLLTREWFAGRRGRYVRPLSLFIGLNIVFFVIQPHSGLLQDRFAEYVGRGVDEAQYPALVRTKMAETGLTRPEFEARFNAALQDQKKSALIVCIPVFALGVALAYARQGRFFVEHLVFSVHVYAFFLVIFLLIPLVFGLVFEGLHLLGTSRETLALVTGQVSLIVALCLVLGTHLYHALRRVYGDGRLAAFARTVALVFLMQLLIFGYHEMVFYTTLLTL
jgi:hypothetical protein